MKIHEQSYPPPNTAAPIGAAQPETFGCFLKDDSDLFLVYVYNMYQQDNIYRQYLQKFSTHV